MKFIAKYKVDINIEKVVIVQAVFGSIRLLGKVLKRADSMLFEHDALKELDDVLDLICWTRIESLLSNIHFSTKGEKAYPPLMMYKALLLQSWYTLSDPKLGET
jgi:hypothetical protein